jgi:hypothetical protein
MKIATLALVLVASVLSAHAAKPLSLEALASANQAKLLHLSTGMTKEEVLSLMGEQTADTRDGVVNNPWTVETSVGEDGSFYEALYYVIRKNQPFTPVRKSLTTAIVLKDGKVIVWGESAFERYR